MRRNWAHAIDPQIVQMSIVPGAKLPKLKMYLMTPRNMGEFCAFKGRNLARGFIQLAKLRMATSVLFKENIDRSLRLCVDYRGLNYNCIESICPLPLMKDMLWHLAKGEFSPNWTSGRHITE